jgi:hypothetical protein
VHCSSSPTPLTLKIWVDLRWPPVCSQSSCRPESSAPCTPVLRAWLGGTSPKKSWKRPDHRALMLAVSGVANGTMQQRAGKTASAKMTAVDSVMMTMVPACRQQRYRNDSRSQWKLSIIMLPILFQLSELFKISCS